MTSLTGSNCSSEYISKTPNSLSMPSKVGWRFKASFGLLCVVNLVCAIDATILSVALPTIAKKLNGTAIEAFWAGTSYLLTSTVFQPAWASFSHIIGRRSVLIAAVTIFTVGSIICSIANGFTWLLTGRGVQGVGGGGIVALTYVIVSDMICLRERGIWFGVISLQWAIGSAIGPVLGGIFAEKNWRWIFWINMPFCLVGLVGIPLCLRLQAREGKVWERLKRFDWIGAFLFVGSLTSFLVPLTWGGILYPWNSWRTFVPLASGALGSLAFLAHSRFLAKDPLIRGSIFSTLTGSTAYISTMIHGVILWSILYYMPLYFEVAKSFTPMKAGIALFPFTLTLGPAAVAVGIIIAITGRYRPSVWIGWFLAAVGTGFLIYLQEETSTLAWVTFCLIPGLGYGILYPAISFATQAPASNSDLPFAAAMFSFFRSLGQTLGVAIGGVVFQNALRYKIQNDPILSDYGKADDWSRDASALVEVIRAVPAGQKSLREGLVHAYVDALRIVWVLMATIAFVAAVGCWYCIEEISLDRELVTEQGFKHGGEEGFEMGSSKNSSSGQSSESQGNLERGTNCHGRLSVVVE